MRFAFLLPLRTASVRKLPTACGIDAVVVQWPELEDHRSLCSQALIEEQD